MTYKLLAEDSTWKAWDLIIDDLSTARNYGEQFKKILQTSNVDGLIAKLEKKASEGGTAAAPADNMKAKSEKGQAAGKAAPAKTAPAKAPAASNGAAAPAKAPAKGPAAAAPVATP